MCSSENSLTIFWGTPTRSNAPLWNVYIFKYHKAGCMHSTAGAMEREIHRP